jgi:TfoX/Sxy family transcriptional regulator of competence genes
MAYNEPLAARIRTQLKGKRGVEEKRMFGGVGFLVHGNMACGVHKNSLIVRLGAADYEQALATPHVSVFDMTGRPMKGWVMVADAGYATEKALRVWVEKSTAFAKSLPPK